MSSSETTPAVSSSDMRDMLGDLSEAEWWRRTRHEPRSDPAPRSSHRRQSAAAARPQVRLLRCAARAAVVGLAYLAPGRPNLHRVEPPCCPGSIPRPCSSAGQSKSLLISRSQVRVLPGALPGGCDVG